MKRLRQKAQQALEFVSKYPAVLSGFVIYGYLFVAIMRFFLKVKFEDATLSDAYDIFSALPFMWFLAVALVKVIETRTKLHESEKQRLQDSEQLRVKETQLNTMKEVVKGLQHHVNNPLAIILLYVARLKRKFAGDDQTLNEIESIHDASKRISSALAEFSNAQRYESEYVEPLVGTIAIPPKP
ncbi:MAG TPA: histidine kinase dimerization/phospho-acceptor domain-containing protein [Bacteroidota bacterium]